LAISGNPKLKTKKPKHRKAIRTANDKKEVSISLRSKNDNI
jgi:hypothetical protein